MRYAKIYEADISNGDGIRVTLFVQGCDNHCPGCFNPETWDWNGGKEYTSETEEEILRLCDKPYIKGLSILGGEPISEENIRDVERLCMRFKERFPNKDIWLWTGTKYIAEETSEDGESIFSSPDGVILTNVLQYIDHLVDGGFVERLKNIKLKYRGSSNQKVYHKIDEKWEEDTTV